MQEAGAIVQLPPLEGAAATELARRFQQTSRETRGARGTGTHARNNWLPTTRAPLTNDQLIAPLFPRKSREFTTLIRSWPPTLTLHEINRSSSIESPVRRRHANASLVVSSRNFSNYQTRSPGDQYRKHHHRRNGQDSTCRIRRRTVASQGKKVCILTRGYGRKDPHLQVIVSDGYGVLASPSEAGDEPYLLATNLAGLAAVISSADRIAAGHGKQSKTLAPIVLFWTTAFNTCGSRAI
jgi:hypothetical protein